jgi:hypothetical protein
LSQGNFLAACKEFTVAASSLEAVPGVSPMPRTGLYDAACEEKTGYSSPEAKGSLLWDLFLLRRKGATILEREYIWVTK